MNRRLIFLLCLLPSLAFSSGIIPYEWQKDRKRYALSDKEKALTEYILKYHREYNYDWEKGELMLYVTEHRITRVTNSETIQRHNRIYISFANAIDLVDLKARSINKDGKVVSFNRDNLKEIKDDESNSTFKIFAIEGIESDSELEYYYTLKMNWKVAETTYFQFEMPIKESSFMLTCPIKLGFDFKVYHDTATVKSDTLPGRNRYQYSFLNVPGLPKEKFSFFDANRKRIESKLAYNYASTQARLNTWAEGAKSYYKTLAKADDDTEKQLVKFLVTLGDDPKAPPVKRIKNIEDKIKNTIKIATQSEQASGYVPDILKFKIASVQGITRLFLLVYTKLGIPLRIVITCDREDAPFDETFDSWNYLDDYLIYFPETKGFISPYENALRYPLIQPKFMATKGLFIEPVTIGGVKSAIGLIRDIPALPYTTDINNLLISVKFDEELESNSVDQTQTFIGYDAAPLANYYNMMTPEQRNKFVDELLRASVPDILVKKWSASISTVDVLSQFAIQSNFTSSHFIERAGPKILFKVGELIGPQSELYRDENRVTDVENTRNRGYDREISVEIPAGYKITNAEALNMKVEYKDGNNIPFLFSSEYHMEGSILKIIIKEFYKEISAPQSRYEDFRKVINASADFNKIKLLIEKR